MIRIPCCWNQLPNHPLWPYTRISASPTITGETTNGRSISESRIFRPRVLPRTRTSAQPTPKIVLSGTAIAAISSVSQNALTAAGVVIHPHATPNPCSNVLANTTPSGSSSSTPRYSSATVRSDRVAGRLMRTARPRPSDQQQHQQRHHEQYHRQRRGGLRGVVLDVREDDDARDLHLPRDQHQRAEFPNRACERERCARDDRRAQRGQHDPAKRRRVRCPQGHRRLLDLLVELDQHRLHGT